MCWVMTTGRGNAASSDPSKVNRAPGRRWSCRSPAIWGARPASAARRSARRRRAAHAGGAAGPGQAPWPPAPVRIADRPPGCCCRWLGQRSRPRPDAAHAGRCRPRAWSGGGHDDRQAGWAAAAKAARSARPCTGISMSSTTTSMSCMRSASERRPPVRHAGDDSMLGSRLQDAAERAARRRPSRRRSSRAPPVWRQRGGTRPARVSQQPDLRELARQDFLVERLHDVFLRAGIYRRSNEAACRFRSCRTAPAVVGPELRAQSAQEGRCRPSPACSSPAGCVRQCARQHSAPPRRAPPRCTAKPIASSMRRATWRTTRLSSTTRQVRRVVTPPPAASTPAGQGDVQHHQQPRPRGRCRGCARPRAAAASAGSAPAGGLQAHDLGTWSTSSAYSSLPCSVTTDIGAAQAARRQPQAAAQVDGRDDAAAQVQVAGDFRGASGMRAIFCSARTSRTASTGTPQSCPASGQRHAGRGIARRARHSGGRIDCRSSCEQHGAARQPAQVCAGGSSLALEFGDSSR